MKTLLAFALTGIVVLSSIGCDQSQTIDRCGDESYTTDGISSDAGPGNVVAPNANHPENKLLSDGAPCDDDSQCENSYCVPSKNSFGAGVCFSLALDGCIVVDEPSPMKQLCSSFTKSLFACGETWDVKTLGECVDIGVGEAGEHYHCCNKKTLP